MRSKCKVWLFLFISFLLCIVNACSKEEEKEELEVYSYDTLEEEIVLENDNLAFHFDPESTHFYVIQKNTGDIWYSNPVDAMSDTLAQGINKQELNATLSLKYNTESGSATTMNNYGFSIEKGNYTYELLDNKIKVDYTIADLEKVYYFPVAVPESRFNEFFSLLDKSAQSQILMCYKIIDINDLGNDDDRDELLATYPDLATERILVLRDSTQEYLKQKIEDFFASVGYTEKDYEMDSARYSVTSSTDKPIFNISIIYQLQEDGLVVSIPLEDIQYKEKYPIVEIKPLAFFGAGGVNDQGFIMVPDGSGGIINFNNLKTSQNPYKSDLYGWDYGVRREAVIDETRCNMPVFGISKGKSSILCVLEEGSAYAYIEADISGRMHQYNYATANYYLVHHEMMDISAKSDKTVRMFQKQLPKEVITQRYLFINSPQYPAMAEGYRSYLMDHHPQLMKKTESDLPVVVELIGAIDRTKHILGVPRRHPYRLTSYEDVRSITKQLVDSGLTDLSIKYNGWFNDGILHKAPNEVKLISELGSKREFHQMVSYLNENNVKLYLESTFQFVNNNTIGDNFLPIRDGAKLVNRKLVELYPYHPIWYGEDQDKQMYYLAKPGYYLKNMESFAKEIVRLGVNNIAFEDIGKVLCADYDDKNEISREAVLKLHSNELSKLRSNGYGLMIESGNMYAVPYADIIVDVNLATRGYQIIDEEIPFYEIVLHGMVDYTGSPVNLAGGYERNLLKTVETGAGLYFIFTQADSFDLQESNYTRYFSSEFREWKEISIELYHKMKKDFGHLYNQYIVDHCKLYDGIYMTEYEDGTKVIVNYNESAYLHNQTEIPAKGYIVEGGKK